MVDHADIIHMNGRIYDSQLGRFLQADPFIQVPKNNQSYNRYSYVLNNPLSYTDPSGYLFKKFGSTLRNVVRALGKNRIINKVISIALIAYCNACVFAWDAATAYATTGSLSGALHAAAISWAGWELDDWMDTSEFFGPEDSWGNLAGKALSTTILVPLNNGDYGHTVKQVSSRETINQTQATCSAGCQMWNVIKNNWRSILFDTVEKTKEHSVHGKYLMSIYDADSAVQGSVNIIDGEYLAGAVAMSGIVARKIKIVDDLLGTTKKTIKILLI